MVEAKAQVNYVNACFCMDRVLDLSDLRKLGMRLESHGCEMIGPPFMNLGQWVEQSLTWSTPNGSWTARLFQISSEVSFGVDSMLFLPGSSISYHPDGDLVFTAYKHLLVDFIQGSKPFIGIIDYDADLLCRDLRSNSFAAWGNYLSNQFLDTWDSDEIEPLASLVDEYITVEKTGILTFNHPLGYGDTSDSQVKFWNIIKSQFS